MMNKMLLVFKSDAPVQRKVSSKSMMMTMKMMMQRLSMHKMMVRRRRMMNKMLLVFKSDASVQRKVSSNSMMMTMKMMMKNH